MKEKLQMNGSGAFEVEELQLKHPVYPRDKSDHTLLDIRRSEHPKEKMRVVDIELIQGEFFVEMADGYVFAVPASNVAKWSPMLKKETKEAPKPSQAQQYHQFGKKNKK